MTLGTSGGMPIDAHARPWKSVGILIAATICIATVGVHSHVLGAMVRPLNAAYGWSRGDIAFALTISGILHPFVYLIVGKLVDSYGAKTVGIPGIAVFVVGTALIGLAGPALWTWYATYSLFTILSSGASAIVWTKIIVDHFTQRRGIALAIALSGAGVMVALVPSFVVSLNGMFGVRGVYPALAVAAGIMMIIPAWLMLPRDRVNDFEHAQSRSAVRTDWKSLYASPRMWRLGTAIFAVGSCVGAFIVHLQPMLGDAGFTPEAAAKIGLLIGPSLVVGRLVTGLLFDCLPTRLVAASAFLLPGIACIGLLTVPLDSTTATALAILIGFGMGCETDVVAYMSSRYFGLANYGLVFGIFISVYGMAIGLGSWLIGRVFDTYGSYAPGLMVLTAAAAVAAALIITLGKPPETEGRGHH